jgi:ABC-2 type transport system permease protein
VKDPRLPVGWINQDPGGLLSASLETLLNHSDVIRPIVLGGQEVDQAADKVTNGDLALVIRLPSGYSQAVITDQPAQLVVIADQTTSSGRAALTAVETVSNRLLGAVESAHISVDKYGNQVGFTDTAAQQAFFLNAFNSAISAWENPPLTVSTAQATGKTAPGGAGMKITGFTQSSAGMIVQFAVFGLINSAMLLMLERKSHCLQRLLTTPIKRAEIISGHVLAMFLIVLVQETILIILGQFVFGVDYLRQPMAVLVMMVVLALWAASVGLLIGALARKEDQVIVICLVAMFVFSALGGAWFPLDVAGKAFSAVGHVLPSAWAVDGFQNIIVRGLDFSSVLAPAGILLLYTLAFFGLALWRFKFE